LEAGISTGVRISDLMWLTCVLPEFIVWTNALACTAVGQ
jgi:hypothetical protein